MVSGSKTITGQILQDVGFTEHLTQLSRFMRSGAGQLQARPGRLVSAG